MKRTRLLTAAAASALVLAGCGSAAPATSSSAVAVAQPAAVAADGSTTCEQDGKPAVASIDPGSITTNPSSWPGGSTMADIRKSKKLTVGVAGDVKLWGSRNPTTGQLEGFDIDVLKRVAQEIGPDVKIEYKVLSFADRLDRLNDRSVQLVAHTMTINCDRWFGGESTDGAYIDFSTEYYEAGQKVLVRSDSEASDIGDLANETVCAAKGSTSLASIQDRVAEPVEVDEVGECLVLFQEGEVSAITGDDTVLAGFAAQDPYAKVVGNAFSTVPYGIGITPDDTNFTRFVNAVLEEMRSDGTLDKLYDKWMAGNGTRPAVPEAVYGRSETALKDRG
ncbi:glutamate ABC transporter substrate-binding protein [Kineosporia sp. J2-2]|uniref:Glutamate ABC transporter substrate-binding protein n=1 Tax=Kineosporia corallincola TaxID=2835133 RepID=A0ABS5TCY2_9ACTN|nr:glutamate ABC transporter substrate-binding protein [Kineosporia corallincola]MBT0767938.1 glutamate ABC transporter substrate-binding protein [Kineosporia corallincola]